jgi:hypothetical protein
MLISLCFFTLLIATTNKYLITDDRKKYDQCSTHCTVGNTAIIIANNWWCKTFESRVVTIVQKLCKETLLCCNIIGRWMWIALSVGNFYVFYLKIWPLKYGERMAGIQMTGISCKILQPSLECNTALTAVAQRSLANPYVSECLEYPSANYDKRELHTIRVSTRVTTKILF